MNETNEPMQEAVLMSRALYDQARVDMQRLVDLLRLCRLFKGYEGGPLNEPWTMHIIKQAETTLTAMEATPCQPDK